jgi:signal transduction histidine kinase
MEGNPGAELTPPPAISTSILEEVSPAVVTRCLGDLLLDGTEPEIQDAVAAVARMVEHANEDVVPDLGSAVLRAALDGLRSEVIARWSGDAEPPPARAMLALLAAFDRAARAIRRAEMTRPTGRSIPGGAEFVAGVAHDLRSPHTSLLFHAETLHAEQSGPITETQRRQLGIIYSAALGLVSVASDIIELVRGGDGLTERRPTPFSVTEMLESVHDIVRPMAEEKGLRVQLFPPAPDLRIGYPLALSRVLLNLTTNGLKFTESGFVEITCRSLTGTRVEFSVRDTGRGYSPEALDEIYQPFRRSRDGRRYGFSGTGLGLAISRKLVAALDSELMVESRPTRGTRFYFELDLPPGPDAT